MAMADLKITDGGIDAFNESYKEKLAQEASDDFAFAAGLETAKPPIVTAREWMGVIEVIYPLMRAEDRIHPMEFIKERLEEKPNFDIPEADLEYRVRTSSLTAEEILEKHRENSQQMWDKQSAIRESAAEIFKTIEPTEEAPENLIEKINQFLDKRANQAATDSWLERGNESLATVNVIREEINALETAVH